MLHKLCGRGLMRESRQPMVGRAAFAPLKRPGILDLLIQ